MDWFVGGVPNKAGLVRSPVLFLLLAPLLAHSGTEQEQEQEQE